MKKLLIVLLALLMLFTFAACGDKGGQNTPPKDETTVTPNDAEKPNDMEQPNNPERPDDTDKPDNPENSDNPSDTDNPEKPGDAQPPIEDEKEITTMYLYINANKLEVTLAKNSAVDALVELLKQGDITYTANDYGGFEKVGSLGHSLPTENSQITTQAGDVILYSGNQIVLFYGSNSWSYTRLGKINGYSVAELRALLGAGNGSIQVRISLN